MPSGRFIEIIDVIYNIIYNVIYNVYNIGIFKCLDIINTLPFQLFEKY